MTFRRSPKIRPLYDDNGRKIFDYDFVDLAYAQWDGLGDMIGINASAYANLAEADTAAVTTDKQLLISTIWTIVPTELNAHIKVMPGGGFNNSGPVTINATFEAGNYQVFFGAGSIVFNINTRVNVPPCWYGNAMGSPNSVNRSITNDGVLPESTHAFEDNSVINFIRPKAANYNAYASYDANVILTGVGDYDHYVGFQARPTYTGSGSIWNKMAGVNTRPVHSGSGVIANVAGVYVQDPGGTGVITNNYGVFIQPQTRGSVLNYNIYAVNGKSYLGETIILGAAGGAAAALRLQGNGITGNYGFSVNSQADSTAAIWQASNADMTFATNNIERMRIYADGKIRMAYIPTYADNAAAKAGGLTTSQLYKTATGQMMIVY